MQRKLFKVSFYQCRSHNAPFVLCNPPCLLFSARHIIDLSVRFSIDFRPEHPLQNYNPSRIYHPSLFDITSCIPSNNFELPLHHTIHSFSFRNRHSPCNTFLQMIVNFHPKIINAVHYSWSLFFPNVEI